MTAQSVVSVAWSWLMCAEPEPPAQHLDSSFAQRVMEAARRAARADARPLLARATHPGGWIQASVLVDRVGLLGEDVDERDLAQALLRLAPDGRASRSRRPPTCPAARARSSAARSAVTTSPTTAPRPPPPAP